MSLFLIIILLGVALDRVTKFWAMDILKGGSSIEVIRGFFTFEYLENRGAAFGMLQNKQWFFIVITVVVVAAMIYYLLKKKPESKLIVISMAMIISGAIGNLIDRVYYRYVVDFIMLHYKDVYYFPTFNVADIFVTVGTIFLLICILKEEI